MTISTKDIGPFFFFFSHSNLTLNQELLISTAYQIWIFSVWPFWKFHWKLRLEIKTLQYFIVMTILLHEVSVNVPKNNINFSRLEWRCSVSLYTLFLGELYNLNKLIGINEAYTLSVDLLLKKHMGLKRLRASIFNYSLLQEERWISISFILIHLFYLVMV